METIERTSVLKEYYGRYLKEIRGLTQSSINHYYDALNNISRRLREKQLVQTDIYEITDSDYLFRVRDILYSDPDFIDLNERGKRMYSAGLNNYLRFVKGEEFETAQMIIGKIDMPFAAEEPRIIKQKIWSRSDILRGQSIAAAGYKCEIDAGHKSFIAEVTKKPYMEGHFPTA